MKLDLKTMFNITAVCCKYEQSIFGKNSTIEIKQRTKAFVELMQFNLRSGGSEEMMSETGETVYTYTNRSHVWAIDHSKGFLNLLNGEKPDGKSEIANCVKLTEAQYLHETQLLEQSLCDFDLVVNQNSANDVGTGNAFLEKFIEIYKQANQIKQGITEDYVYQAITHLSNRYRVLTGVLGLGTKDDMERSGFEVVIKDTGKLLTQVTIEITDKANGSVTKINHTVNDKKLNCISDAELTVYEEHALYDYIYDTANVIRSKVGYKIELGEQSEYSKKTKAILLNTEIRTVAKKLIERNMPPSPEKLVEYDSLPRAKIYYKLINSDSISVGTSYFLKDVERMKGYIAPEHSFLYQLNDLIEKMGIDDAAFAIELVANGFNLEQSIQESFNSLINRAKEQNADNESLCIEEQHAAEKLIQSVKSSCVYEAYTSLNLASTLEATINEIEGLSNTLARDYDITTTMTL